MKAFRFTPSASAFAFVCVLLGAVSFVRADRFIVPTNDSSSSSSNGSPPPPPAPPPPAPPPSGGGSNHTPPSSSNNSDRFVVPTPSDNRDRSSRSGGGGGYDGGYRGGHGSGGGYDGGYRRGYGGHSYYDPFWGGCYYWGGNYYYWGGHYYDPSYQRFGRYRDSIEYDYRTVPAAANNRSPIFFPPSPPPLGAPIPPRQPPSTSITAPAGLAAYVYEPFYAPLSTRLSQADLTKKNLQRLDAYRSTRNRLREELIQRLDRLKDTDPATRASELGTLALAQAGELTKLEAEADDLRGDLLHGGLVGIFSGTGDWNENRRWRLGEGNLSRRSADTVSAEFRVIRAAAFYQEGLSPAQRRLLREVEMELQVEAFKPKTASSHTPDEKLFFFSPETARLPVATDLPASLSLKLETYEKDKSALKAELRDALYSLDSAPAPKRAGTLRKVAETQAPHFATLEALAEEIRAEFALLPNPPGPAVPPAFPPALSARLTVYQAEKAMLQKELQAGLDEVRKTKSAVNLTATGTPDGIRFETPRSETSSAVIAAARKSVENFNKQHQERLAALTKEREAIRADVARFAAEKDSGSGKSVETLLNDFNTHLQQGERWQHYRYYQLAMLEPGLSPEQRRLLFEAALERLNLPLPAGEYPP